MKDIGDDEDSNRKTNKDSSRIVKGINMAEVSIYGKVIRNAIGYCHCERHKGALNREIAYKNKCVAKKCKS